MHGRSRLFCISHGVEVDRHTICHGTKGFRIHETAQTCNDGLSHLVLTSQFVQRITTQDLRVGATSGDAGVFHGDAQQETIQCGCIFEVELFFTCLDLVQGWLSNINVAALYQLWHLTIEKGQQQSTNVSAIHIRVSHDDDAVIAQLINIEVVCRRLTRLSTGFANTSTQSRDQRQDFVTGQQFFVTCFFNVQDFAAKRQNGLEFPVTSLLG